MAAPRLHRRGHRALRVRLEPSQPRCIRGRRLAISAQRDGAAHVHTARDDAQDELERAVDHTQRGELPRALSRARLLGLALLDELGRTALSHAAIGSPVLDEVEQRDAIEGGGVAVELGDGEARRRLHLRHLLAVPVDLGFGGAAAHARQADAQRAKRAVGELEVREVGGERTLALGRVIRRAGHVLGLGEQHARDDVGDVAHLPPHVLGGGALGQRASLDVHHLEDLRHDCLQLVGGHLAVDEGVVAEPHGILVGATLFGLEGVVCLGETRPDETR